MSLSDSLLAAIVRADGDAAARWADALRAVQAHEHSSLGDLKDTQAAQRLAARREALPLSWLSLPPAEGFAEMSALSPEAKQALFAWCIAHTNSCSKDLRCVIQPRAASARGSHDARSTQGGCRRRARWSSGLDQASRLAAQAATPGCRP